MTLLAPTLQTFFTERLMTQRQASPHTIAGYRDTMRLLLAFAHEQTGKPPSKLELDDLDAELISAFLDAPRDRNAATAPGPATPAWRRSIAVPLRRVQAPRARRGDRTRARDPAKRFDRALITYLTKEEIDALLAAPDRTPGPAAATTRCCSAIQTGLRVSELTGLRCQDIQLDASAYLPASARTGRNAPSRSSHAPSRRSHVWLKRTPRQAQDPLFPTIRGGRSPRRRRMADRPSTPPPPASAARHSAPSGSAAHVLRHTTAMTLLQSDISTTVIALWLGHEQGEHHPRLPARDLRLKQRAIDRTAPPNSQPGRDRAADTLLAFLDNL